MHLFSHNYISHIRRLCHTPHHHTPHHHTLHHLYPPSSHPPPINRHRLCPRTHASVDGIARSVPIAAGPPSGDGGTTGVCTRSCIYETTIHYTLQYTKLYNTRYNTRYNTLYNIRHPTTHSIVYVHHTTFLILSSSIFPLTFP